MMTGSVFIFEESPSLTSAQHNEGIIPTVYQHVIMRVMSHYYIISPYKQTFFVVLTRALNVPFHR